MNPLRSSTSPCSPTLVTATALALAAAVATAAVQVTVDPSRALGPVKPMNAVNNGPVIARSDQSRGNFAEETPADIQRPVGVN